MAQISEDLIIRFINNSCTDEELIAVKNWLDESDENAARLFETEQMAMLAGSVHKDDAAGQRISDNITRRIIADELNSRRRSRKATLRWVSGIAAMLVLAVGIGLIFFGTPDVKMIHVAAAGKSISVTLPDSSTVFLNKNSELTYPEHFADNSRRVELEGEGFFKVTRDKKRPFTVSGHHLEVEVLGTQFNFVSSDSIENSVSLVEGSVEVSAPGRNEGAVLSPGQKATYNVATGQLTIHDTNAQVDAAWHDRIIPFENASLSDIIAILNQLYNVEIEIAGNTESDKTYSGVTVFYDDIDSTLTYLSHTLPIKFSNKKDRIIVSIK